MSCFGLPWARGGSCLFQIRPEGQLFQTCLHQGSSPASWVSALQCPGLPAGSCPPGPGAPNPSGIARGSKWPTACGLHPCSQEGCTRGLKIRPIRLTDVDGRGKVGEGMLEAWGRKRPFTVFRKVLNSGTKPKFLLAAEEVRPLGLCCNFGGIKAGGDPRGPFRLLLAGPQVPALLAPRPASSPRFYTVQPNAASRLPVKPGAKEGKPGINPQSS